VARVRRGGFTFLRGGSSRHGQYWSRSKARFGEAKNQRAPHATLTEYKQPVSGTCRETRGALRRHVHSLVATHRLPYMARRIVITKGRDGLPESPGVEISSLTPVRTPSEQANINRAACRQPAMGGAASWVPARGLRLSDVRMRAERGASVRAFPAAEAPRADTG